MDLLGPNRRAVCRRPHPHRRAVDQYVSGEFRFLIQCFGRAVERLGQHFCVIQRTVVDRYRRAYQPQTRHHRARQPARAQHIEPPLRQFGHIALQRLRQPVERGLIVRVPALDVVFAEANRIDRLRTARNWIEVFLRQEEGIVLVGRGHAESADVQPRPIRHGADEIRKREAVVLNTKGQIHGVELAGGQRGIVYVRAQRMRHWITDQAVDRRLAIDRLPMIQPHHFVQRRLPRSCLFASAQRAISHRAAQLLAEDPRSQTLRLDTEDDRPSRPRLEQVEGLEVVVRVPRPPDQLDEFRRRVTHVQELPFQCRRSLLEMMFAEDQSVPAVILAGRCHQSGFVSHLVRAREAGVLEVDVSRPQPARPQQRAHTRGGVAVVNPALIHRPEADDQPLGVFPEPLFESSKAIQLSGLEVIQPQLDQIRAAGYRRREILLNFRER